MEKEDASRTEKDIRAAVRTRFLQLVLTGAALLSAVGMLMNDNSLGWFSGNKIVDGTGMSVQSDVTDLKADYTLYTHSVSPDIAEGKVLSSTHGNSIDIAFQPLDMVFQQQNRCTALVIRVHLVGADLLDGSEISLSLHRTGKKSVLTQLDRTGSSIFRFTGAVGDSLYSDTPADLYRNLDTLLYDFTRTAKGNLKPAADNPAIGSSAVFALPGDAGYTKESYVNVRIPYTRKNVKSGAAGKPEMNVYLYVSYDPVLTDALRRQATAAPGFGGTGDSQTVQLENDFETLFISAVRTAKP